MNCPGLANSAASPYISRYSSGSTPYPAWRRSLNDLSRSRFMRHLMLSCLVLLGATSLAAQEPYKKPPQIIVDVLDAPPLPAVSVSPDRTWLLLMEQASMPTIAEFAQPILRIAGVRINPRTTGPQLPGPI